jgi:uncharacterized repeat protein (TIGR01451 family)
MKNALTSFIHFRASIFALLFLMAALPNSGDAQTLFDNTFNNTDWNCTVLPYPKSAPAPPASASPCGQDTSKGNPLPPSRITGHNYSTNPKAIPDGIWVAHLYQPVSYNPSVQGAIAGLSYFFDLITYSPPSQPGQGVTHCLLLFQNNTYYEKNGGCDSTSGPAWSSFANTKTLTATDFDKTFGPGPKRPDFSCKGSVIQFGYLTGNSSTQNTLSAIDRWRVNIAKGADCICFKRLQEAVACGNAGNYTYTVQLQNLTGTPIQQIVVMPTLPAGVTLTQQIFPGTLPVLGTATLQVTIKGAPAGSTVTLRFVLSGGGSECCSTEVQVTVPAQGQC